MRTRHLTLALPLVCSAVALMPSSIRAQSFLYTNFSNPTGLQINGNAFAPATGENGTSQVLRLTSATDSQAGSAFSLSPVQLGDNASFSTAFSFQLWDGGGISDGTGNQAGADGLVFVLNTVSNTVGSSGQGVGYQGINNSVGVKFDTWDDSAGSFPQDNDPNGNFVAIYADGSTHMYDPDLSDNTASYNNYADDAHAYYTPSDLMKNGNIWYAWVDYNGVTDELDVSLSETDVRPSTPDLSEIIDLNSTSILGSSPEVYAGFTSGTGAAYDATDILSWQFNDTYDPIQTVGAPSGVPDAGPDAALLAAILFGLCGLAAFGRRRELEA